LVGAIEQRMHEIVKRDLPIVREVWDATRPSAPSASWARTYKVQIIDDIIPEGEEVSVYRQGDWFDVCRGPHLPSHRQARQRLQADEAGRRLLARRLQQRHAAAHLRHRLARQEGAEGLSDRLEEAEKRDHRRSASSWTCSTRKAS
jgi:threonyl-tRNA synthetase